MVRVTERQRYFQLENNISKVKNESVRALNQVSSQKKINEIHDDPIGAAKIIRSKSRLSEMKSFEDNLAFGKGFVSTSEKALMMIQESLIRAKELSLAGASDTYNVDSRVAIAKEVGQLVDSIVQTANTRFGSKYIFSGFRTSNPAFDAQGSYLGDDGEIFLQLGDEKFQKINIPGREIFNGNVDNREGAKISVGVIDNLVSLKRGLESNNKDLIYHSMNEIGNHSDLISTSLSEVGSIANAMDKSSEQLQLSIEFERKKISDIEDADVFEASSDFKRAEQLLQSTLQASSNMLQPSLLNFLR